MACVPPMQLDVFSAGVMAAEIGSGRCPAPGPEFVREGRRRVTVIEEERRAADIAAVTNAELRTAVVERCVVDYSEERADAAQMVAACQQLQRTAAYAEARAAFEPPPAREQEEREAREQEEREAREQQEREAREQREREARERRERQAREQQEREAREQRERVVREQHEREVREQRERETREQREREETEAAEARRVRQAEQQREREVQREAARLAQLALEQQHAAHANRHPANAVFRVSNSGEDWFNGYYTQDGECNSKPKYKKLDEGGGFYKRNGYDVEIYCELE